MWWNTHITQPAARAVDSVKPFIPPATVTDQTGTDQVPVQQKEMPFTAMLSHQLDRPKQETDPVHSYH